MLNYLGEVIMHYWIELVILTIPGLLFSLLFFMLPLNLGLFATIRHFMRRNRISYLKNLSGSIAAGTVTLLMLYGSLFGDDLSSSSTAALVFLFAPIYAAITQGIVYGLSSMYIYKSDTSKSITKFERSFFLVPFIIFLILSIGMIKNSIEGIDRDIAYSASYTETLTRVYEKSLNGEADSFSIPLGLAQNPKTPTWILEKLATHEHPAIRTKIARHSKTPIQTVRSLTNDTCFTVRDMAKKHLASQNNE